MPTSSHTSGHRALRRGRWSDVGRIYLVTATTHRRGPVFGNHPVAAAACRCFHLFDRQGTAALVAWVLMPDHAHWLLRLGEGESLSQAVNRLKSGSARCIRRRHRNTGTVWARAYHDRGLRSEDSVEQAARYVVANPIRAGLVERIGDYPYWDSKFL